MVAAVQFTSGGPGEQMVENPASTPLIDLKNAVYKTALITLGIATAIVASSPDSCHGFGDIASEIKNIVLQNPALCAKGLFAASFAPEAYRIVKYLAFENPTAGATLVAGAVGAMLAAKFNK